MDIHSYINVHDENPYKNNMDSHSYRNVHDNSSDPFRPSPEHPDTHHEVFVHKILLCMGYRLGLIDISHYGIIIITIFGIMHVILVNSCVSGSGS